MKNSFELNYNVSELEQDELVNIAGGTAAEVGYAIGYGVGFAVGFAVFGVGAFVIMFAKSLF